MIEIRAGFHPEEIPRLYELETQCFDEPVRWDLKNFAPALQKLKVWVAILHEVECPPRIVGFIAADLFYGNGYVWTIEVDPKEQGKGIGAKLMYAAEDFYRAAGRQKMRLEVQVNNPAQTLYFKIGYRVTKVKEKHYTDGSDCLEMVKELPAHIQKK